MRNYVGVMFSLRTDLKKLSRIQETENTSTKNKQVNIKNKN